jgi:uncharacterized protein YbjT (DUF2867 family)
MYAITGATGNIGSKAADILLTNGEKVRVIGRNAAGLQRFVDRGAEAAVGNLKDSEFATRAFKGATAVFAMIPPDYTSSSFRAYQNEVGTSIATAIRNSGVRYVVNLSSQGAELSAGTGPILGMHDQEERLNRLEDVNILHLRCTYFMENLLMSIPLIKEKGYAASAVRGNLEFAMIATRDIAACVAEQLVKKNFAGRTVWDLLGQRDLSLNEAYAVIGREIGWPSLKYSQFSYEEAERWRRESGISSDLCRLLTEMNKALNEGLFAVNQMRYPFNTTTTSIEDFAVTFAEIYAASTERKAA